MPDPPEAFEIHVPDQVLDDLRSRLRRARWPQQPAEEGWQLGVDIAYLRELCEYWADRYDWRGFESRLSGFDNLRWNGLHLIRERSDQDGLCQL